MIPEVTAAGQAVRLALGVVSGELLRVRTSMADGCRLAAAEASLQAALASVRAAYSRIGDYVTLADRAGLAAANGSPGKSAPEKKTKKAAPAAPKGGTSDGE